MPQSDGNPSFTEQNPQNKSSPKTGGSPGPLSPKPDDQLKALQEELARMWDELEAKKFENLDF